MAAVAAEPVSATTTTITTATEQPGPAEERSLIPGSVSPLALLETGAPEGAPEAWRHGADRALALSRHHRPEMQPSNPADLLEETDWRGMGVDPECAAVFLHSLPAAAPRSEPGLSLEEPDQPRASEDRAEGHGDPDPSWHTDGPTEGLACHIDGLTEQAMEQGLRHTDLHTEGQAEGHTDPNPTGLTDQAMDQAPSAPPASVQGLIPGSEVRVVMDHVIDDALVVSFRLGEKVFSGVLMDVSKRFGPYGIPITVFPRRDDQSRPQVAVESEPVAVDDPSSNQTVSVGKPPPLFQEGAAYPPPLFIRDTYNQALPQPLPRKIKRPKRRYRCEEPTSIMNAIKLRPRQVLCDKCRAVMSSGRAVMSPRRRHEDGPVSSEVKRLRSDDRQLPRVTTRNGRVTSDPTGRGSDRRPSSGIRVTRGVASSSAVCLNAAKARTVLPKDTHPKGPTSIRPRQALNPNRSNPVRPGSRAMNPPAPPDRSRAMNPNLKPMALPPPAAPQGSRAVTRSSAQQGQRIHFTRLSGANVSLPPRTRLKPQRYRTEDAAELKPKQSPPPSAPPPSEASLAMATLELGAEPISLDSECSSSLTFNVPMCSDAATVSIPTNPVTPDSISTDTAVSISADTAVSISADTAVSISAEATTDSIPPDTAVSIPPDTAISIPPDTAVSITPDTACNPSPSSGPGADSIPADPDSAVRADSEELKTRRRATCPTSGLSKSVSKCFLPDGRSVCVGDIVWAKIYGFPWWPARVLGISVLRRGEANVQEARVSWFGSPTTSVLALAALSPFLESFQTRFDRKRKGPYRRAIAEAASAAKQLTPEVRALLTQFET